MMLDNTLTALGWNAALAECFGPFARDGLSPARIGRQDRDAYLILCEHGEVVAQVSGRFRHLAKSNSDFPTVGDWVAVQVRPAENSGTIQAVLPRRSCFVRKAPGGPTQDQVIAANVDTAFIVCGLDGDFNPRRIERYLAVAYDSGASPVILLNKADICPDIDDRVADVQTVAVAVPVHVVSANAMSGLAAIESYLRTGSTSVMLGSSGVGKSSLINSLLGSSQLAVQAVRRHDSHGRHTTTHRELILLPQGGLVIDTPGMRELQLWASEECIQDAFSDVEELAGQCRFRDCGHRAEPGCAVIAAIESGQLPAQRLDSFRRLQREVIHLEKKQAQRSRLMDKSTKKHKAYRERNSQRQGDTLD